MTFTAAEKLATVERMRGIRQAVVDKLPADLAERAQEQLDVLTAIADDYRNLAAEEAMGNAPPCALCGGTGLVDVSWGTGTERHACPSCVAVDPGPRADALAAGGATASPVLDGRGFVAFDHNAIGEGAE